MLPLAFLMLGCAALQSAALPVLVQYQAKDELGQYQYGYSGGPSAKREERTLDGVTRGSYSYIDGNGIVQTRAYEADDYNGFRVVGTDIVAPTGVSRSGTILSSAGLPVSDHAAVPAVKSYQPVGLGLPYVKAAGGYNDVRSYSGNEISVAPVAYSVRRTYTPYSTPVEYLSSPYKYRAAAVSEPTKYYKQHYISPNSLQVSPLSSVGIRVPSAYPAPSLATISSVQSTVTPPPIYATQVPVTVAPPVQTVSIRESPIPIRASYTPTYQTAASQVVSSSYVPATAAPIAYRATPVVAASSVSYRATPAVAASSVSYRPPAVGILNTRPAPISYLDAAPGPIAVSTSAPATVAIAEAAPAVVAYTKAAPAVSYATAAPPSVTISNPGIAVYTSAPEVTYTGASPVVTYTSAVPSAVSDVSYASPAVTYTSAVPFTYSTGSTPFTYGYNPTTSHIIRYANTAPSVRATIYEPAGGYLAAKPIPLQDAIASQYHAQDELGQYRYGYANINSAKEETKTIDGVTRGSFSYVDANGVLQSRSYVSDDVNGFRVIGTDIPRGPDGQVNPDAIPSEHVAPAVAAAVPAPVAAVHSQQVIATAVPAALLPHNAVEVSPTVVVSSTPATLSILK